MTTDSVNLPAADSAGVKAASAASLEGMSAAIGDPAPNRPDFAKNNLDCLRLVLASIVVFFHISALTDSAPYAIWGRVMSAHFAVRSFFVISGFLIYRSYERSSSIGSYFRKRFRRIYPAYFTVIAVSALGLVFMSSLPLSHYFGLRFFKYVAMNLAFLNFLAPSLPGVFQQNPLPAVDGALWTIKIEVAFYLFVPFLHFLCRRFGERKILGILACLSLIWKYGFGLLASMHSTQALDSSRSIFTELDVQFPGQFIYFCAGILLLLYFEKLRSHLAVICGLTACLYLIDHFFTGELFDVFWISGVVLIFGFWRYFGNFAKHGDFSYGVYIVHWPILQILIALGLSQRSPLIFISVSLSLILSGAWLLWHLVESRFLSSSSHYRQVTLPNSAHLP